MDFISDSYCTIVKSGVGNYPLNQAYVCNLKLCTRVENKQLMLKVYRNIIEKYTHSCRSAYRFW